MGNWVPYPKFLAMFEGQQPRDLTSNGSESDAHVASAQPEKLKVAMYVYFIQLLLFCRLQLLHYNVIIYEKRWMFRI